jgi:KipI family sensor histidine kinase inhibitor
MRLVRAGDTMLLVELEARIDRQVNQQAIELAARLRDRALHGVRDVVPAYCSVGVHFDPLQTDLAALEKAITAAGIDAPLTGDAAPADDAKTRDVVEIPVSYGGEGGPDLEAVAQWAGCSPEEVIERHLAREYRVYMLGFVGGFAYMGNVDPSIAAPRHRTPRERVPVGSVGIAGGQTGIYPLVTPGGWQIIGHTDVPMFDIARTPPNRLVAGDTVRFVRVTGAR